MQQPRIARIAYVDDSDLEALSKEVTELLNKKEEHWEVFGDLKKFDDKYVQTMIHVVFPTSEE